MMLIIANKLSLNASKTKYVYFRTVNSKPPSSVLNLVIRNKPIERVSSNRVLGTISMKTCRGKITCYLKKQMKSYTGRRN